RSTTSDWRSARCCGCSWTFSAWRSPRVTWFSADGSITSTAIASICSGSGFGEENASSPATRKDAWPRAETAKPGSERETINAAASSCSVRARLGDQRHALEAGTGDGRHHRGDAAVVDLLVATNIDP